MGSPDFAAFERYAQELTETLEEDIQRHREAMKLGLGDVDTLILAYRVSHYKRVYIDVGCLQNTWIYVIIRHVGHVLLSSDRNGIISAPCHELHLCLDRRSPRARVAERRLRRTLLNSDHRPLRFESLPVKAACSFAAALMAQKAL